jgi:Flp pilus assembly protein TadD
VLAGLYLLIWDRRRLLYFLPLVVALAAGYLAMKSGATGLNTNPDNAPIDRLNIWGRLLTAPSVMIFYVGKILWPLPLASGYYWVQRDFSFTAVLLPIIGDIAVFAGFVLLGRWVSRAGSADQRKAYWFFGLWAAIGLLAHLGVVALDETASEAYLYFPFLGLIGMIGVAVTVMLQEHPLRHRTAIGAVLVSSIVIAALGARTAVRAADWHDARTLALHDLAASPQNFQADLALVIPEIQQERYDSAVSHARHAVAQIGTSLTYNALGLALLEDEQYADAQAALETALQHQRGTFIWDNLGLTTVFYGDPNTNHAILTEGLKEFPNDGKLWLYLAILDENHGANEEAKTAITNAYRLGAANSTTYQSVMAGQILELPARPGPPS